MKWDTMIQYDMTWPRLVFLAVTLFGWVKYYFLCCLSLFNLSSSQRFIFFGLQWGSWSSIWGTSVMIFAWCGCSGVYLWCLKLLGTLRFDVWVNFIFWIYINKMLLPRYLFCFLLLLVLSSSCQREGGNWFVGLLFLQNFVACCWCLRGWEMHVFYFLWAIILIGLNLEGACCWPNVCQW